MNAWLERWQEGQIGWHEAAGNAALKTCWQYTGKRVLVPLCGKSQDLLWLEQAGNAVAGVELSELAVLAFFEENGLAFEKTAGPLDVYRATGRDITIYCGDYFLLQGQSFDAHYDRAALIAMPADKRPDYVAHTQSLLDTGAKQLVVTLEYEQVQADGPPFSVPGEELQGYWPGLERLASREDIDNAPPKFHEAGLSSMHEVVWRSR